MHTTICTLLLLLTASLASAGDWVNFSDELLKTVPQYKDSWAWNRRVGMLIVNPKSCDLFVALSSGYGVWQSSDGGKTFACVDKKTVNGRGFGGFSISLDPKTGRMAVFMVGHSSGITLDNGKTWTGFGRPKIKEKHDGWSFGDVNWNDGATVILAKEHHSERLWLSRDAGKTWSKLDVEGRKFGVVDEQTFLHVRKDGVYRSGEQGETWTKVSDAAIVGAIPVKYGPTLYWTCKEGLLKSTDGGANWSLCAGKLPRLQYGPYFGATESDMLVANKDGVYISSDGGETWGKVADFPVITDAIEKGKYGERYPLYSFGWDWQRKVIYAASVGGSGVKLSYD